MSTELAPASKPSAARRGASSASLCAPPEFRLVNPENPDLCDSSKSQWYLDPAQAERIAKWALGDSDPTALRVLEPSAGRGALAIPLRNHGCHVTCVDIDLQNAAHLKQLGFETHHYDFLKLTPVELGQFDLVVMNSPFEDGQAESHIMHALTFAPWVVAHAPLTTLAGKDRAERLWSSSTLTELVVYARRPKYSGNKRGGETDMANYRIAPGNSTPLQAAAKVEWWL